MATKPKAPKNLRERGRRTWDNVTSKYELRFDELDILEDVCREIDLIDSLEESLEGAPQTVRGSQGQEVANPLITELRQHRSTKKALWGAIKLPEEGNLPAVNQQRDAIQSRWANAHGKTA